MKHKFGSKSLKPPNACFRLKIDNFYVKITLIHETVRFFRSKKVHCGLTLGTCNIASVLKISYLAKVA